MALVASEGLSKGEQTRHTILAAAIDRFGRDGFRSTSVADIARDAGVSGTAAYAYFENKEALFLAAVDEDAAGVIEEGLASIDDDTSVSEWPQRLFFTLAVAVERHPLARRLLAGLEPDVTDRVADLPALEEVRKVMAERIRREQLEGTVRADIDPVAVTNGLVAIVLSLLMSVVQVGERASGRYGADVATVFAAVLQPPPR